MDRPQIGASLGVGAANGTTEAARADALVAHAREHLAYQRAIAARNTYRPDARLVQHDTKDTTR